MQHDVLYTKTISDHITAESPETKRSPRTPEKEVSVSKIAKHSTYAQQKLHSLDERIANKTQALQALRLSQKADKKVSLQKDQISTS